MNIIKNYLIIVNLLLMFNLNVYAKTYESESLIDACYNEDMFCNVVWCLFMYVQETYPSLYNPIPDSSTWYI